MTPMKIRLLVAMSCALLLAACATSNINLPSITESPTGERLPGKIVWHDLLTNDPAASKQLGAAWHMW